MTDIVDWLRSPKPWHKYSPDEVADEIERLRAERDAFYMDYRMKCDEETKRLTVRLSKAEALLDEALGYAGERLAEKIHDYFRGET